MQFHFIQKQSYFLRRVIQKTYSSVIIALLSVRFDAEFTDIKQQHVLLTLTLI